ncbi:LysR substrate-binding domain-containing protein [Phenylobacterium sp.]|jgi:DNA-binding transcriptional LysR family regulator|uniref:LysR substrate-binding domain-containing protein n=1 Tax=Phenylobacterium sp. TaxID=1871053 RepID=UPI002F3F2F2E
MHPRHIANLDLNLLRVFDAVFEEGGVTRAGVRLGVTQSAVSHALNRLRYILDDELFLRGSNGMQPTARAQAIGPQVRAALEQLQSALATEDFEPATSERQFTFAAAAYVCAVLTPSLVSQLSVEAPNVGLHFVEAPDLAERLDAGGVDFAIGVFDSLPQRFAGDPILNETLVWVVRRGHPLANSLKRLEDLVQAPHVVINNRPRGVPAGARGGEELVSRPGWEDADRVERALAMRGLRRRVGVTVSDTTTALAVVSRSEMIAIAPRRLALMASDSGRVQLIDPTDASPPVEVQIVYRRDRMSEPAVAWMREQLLAIGKTV